MRRPSYNGFVAKFLVISIHKDRDPVDAVPSCPKLLEFVPEARFTNRAVRSVRMLFRTVPTVWGNMSEPQKTLILTVREVSKLLRIHRPKVYDLIKEGTIEGFKLGADWRVRRESVERLIGPIPDSFFGETRMREPRKGPKLKIA